MANYDCGLGDSIEGGDTQYGVGQPVEPQWNCGVSDGPGYTPDEGGEEIRQVPLLVRTV